jgi:hypothetical protein
MVRLDSEALAAIARAIEEAPRSYCLGLTASAVRERLRAVDALTGWIGARLAPPSGPDGQLMLPMEGGL